MISPSNFGSGPCNRLGGGGGGSGNGGGGGGDVKFRIRRPPVEVAKRHGMHMSINVSVTDLRDFKGNEAVEDASPFKNCIISPPFEIGETVGKRSKWQIVLNPHHYENGERYLSFGIRMDELEESQERVNVVYTLVIQRYVGSPEPLFRKTSYIREFTRDRNHYGWEKYILFSKLGNPEQPLKFTALLQLYDEPLPEAERSLAMKTYFPRNNQQFRAPSYCMMRRKKGSADADAHSDVTLDTQSSDVTPEPQIAPGGVANNEAPPADVEIKTLTMTWPTKAPYEILKRKADYIFKQGNDDGRITRVLINKQRFLVFTDRLRKYSGAFARHLQNLRPGEDTTFRPEGVMPKSFDVVVRYTYRDKDDEIPPMAPSEEMYTFLATLWDAAIQLEIHSLERVVAKEILKCVNSSNFTTIYVKMEERHRILYETDHSLTKNDFIRTLIDLRKTCPTVMADYAECKPEYAVLFFT